MPSAKPKPDPIPEFVTYRATTDIYVPGVGTIPANGTITASPSDPDLTPFIAQGLLVN